MALTDLRLVVVLKCVLVRVAPTGDIAADETGLKETLSERQTGHNQSLTHTLSVVPHTIQAHLDGLSKRTFHTVLVRLTCLQLSIVDTLCVFFATCTASQTPLWPVGVPRLLVVCVRAQHEGMAVARQGRAH